MERLDAPFTPDQVAALSNFQTCGYTPSFTCRARERYHPSRKGLLIPGPDGWHCEVVECPYTQTWAHAFMADPAFIEALVSWHWEMNEG